MVTSGISNGGSRIRILVVLANSRAAPRWTRAMASVDWTSIGSSVKQGRRNTSRCSGPTTVVSTVRSVRLSARYAMWMRGMLEDGRATQTPRLTGFVRPFNAASAGVGPSG